MTTQASATPGPSGTAVPAVVPSARRARPVLWWAGFGTVAVAAQTCVYWSWITSTHFRAVPTGADPLPMWEGAWSWILQTGVSSMAVVAIAWVARGCVREGRLSFDAKLMIGWFSMAWLDVGPNFLRPQVMFNSHYFNRGSWGEFIPGWISPNPHLLPVALLLEIPVFASGVFFVRGSCRLMLWARSRWPRLGTVGVLLVAWLSQATLMFVIEEIFYIRTGWLVWNGTIHGLTLFAGTRWQMPMLEPLFWGAACTAMVALRFFRDGQGRTIAERGVDRVRTRRPWILEAVSVMAIIGFANAASVAYNIAMNAQSLYDGPTPPLPSYIRNGMCGDGTPYGCTGPGVPILLPRPDRVEAHPGGT